MTSCTVALIVAGLMLPALAFAQAPAKPVEQADQVRYPSSELPAIPFIPDQADPIQEHAGDHLTVILRVTQACWTPNQRVLSAWRDEKVQQWMKEQGRVWLTPPLGAQQKKPLSVVRLIGPEPPDGMYAFRDGKVIDHDMEFDDAPELLAWLKYVDSGTIPREFALRRAGSRDGALKLVPHIVLAKRMELAGDEEAAADEYMWTIEQLYRKQARGEQFYDYPMGQYGVLERSSALGMKYPAIRARWGALRDELIAVVADPGKANYSSGRAAREITLFAPDVEGTFALLDKYKDNKRITAMIENLIPLLVATMGSGGQWERAGKAIRDPSAQVRGHMAKLDVLEGLNDGPQPVSKSSPPTYRPIELQCVQSVGIIYAALLAAGRDKEAREAAEEAFKLHDSPTLRACLVLTALKAGQPRDEHRGWAKAGESSWLFENSPPKQTLSERVDEALSKAKPGK